MLLVFFQNDRLRVDNCNIGGCQITIFCVASFTSENTDSGAVSDTVQYQSIYDSDGMDTVKKRETRSSRVA